MCGLAITTNGNEIVSIRGDEKDPLSRGHICPKAIAIQDLYNDPDRLKYPVRPIKGGWERIGWQEAFDEIKTRIKQIRKAYGHDAMAIYYGNPMAHYHGTVLFLGFLLKALKTKNRFSASSVDQLPLMMACYLMFGHQFLFPVPDIDRTDYFILIGANPAVSGGSIMTAPGIARRIKKIQKRGGKVVVIDPVYTKTASLADRHLFITPGTDALLMLALINTVFAEELTDPGRPGSLCDGIETIRTAVSQFTPEDIADQTGITANDIRMLAREFCSAKSGVCYGRLGSCTQEFGTITSWLILAFNIITGKMDQTGGFMFPTPAHDFVHMSALINEKGRIGRHKTRVRGLPDFGGEFPVAAMAEEMLTEGPGQIRALICLAGNPVLSVPNGRLVEKAFKNLDFMVAMDWYVTETSRHANIILPPTNMLEHEHFPTMANIAGVRNVVRYSPKVFEPAADTRHNWQILKELALRVEERPLMRAALRLVTPERLLKPGLRFGPHGAGFWPKNSGLTLAKVARAEHGLDLGPLRPSLPKRLFTKNKRIDLAPSLFIKELDQLKTYQQKGGFGPSGEFDLLLIGRRNLMSNNSWFHNIERMRTTTNRCTLWINTDDAKDRGITNKERVKVSSRVGSIELEAQVTDRIMPGVVSIPHGWGHDLSGIRLSVAANDPGVSVNHITDNERLDTLCGNAVFSGVPVRVDTHELTSVGHS